ncbi:hypothetical protein A2U01_0077054, partial [Trifolium medium]|nr:hypothetical protein [Trifolium medium]
RRDGNECVERSKHCSHQIRAKPPQRNGDSNQQQINDHSGGPAEVKRPLRVFDPKRG